MKLSILRADGTIVDYSIEHESQIEQVIEHEKAAQFIEQLTGLAQFAAEVMMDEFTKILEEESKRRMN